MRKEITGLMLSLALIAPAVANASIWDFGGALNSNQETHPLVLPSPYFGGGLLTAELDDITGQFVMTVGFFGLTGAPIAAHIHPGAPGVAGPPLIDLGAPSGSILGPTEEARVGKWRWFV